MVTSLQFYHMLDFQQRPCVCEADENLLRKYANTPLANIPLAYSMSLHHGLAVLLDKHLFCFTAHCVFFHGSRQLTKPA